MAKKSSSRAWICTFWPGEKNPLFWEGALFQQCNLEQKKVFMAPNLHLLFHREEKKKQREKLENHLEIDSRANDQIVLYGNGGRLQEEKKNSFHSFVQAAKNFPAGPADERRVNKANPAKYYQRFSPS